MNGAVRMTGFRSFSSQLVQRLTIALQKYEPNVTLCGFKQKLVWVCGAQNRGKIDQSM